MADNIKPISKNREKKEKVVASIVETVARAKGLVFTNYQGLTHKQLETLKKAIKPFDANYSITKNTLLKIALEKENIKIEDEKSFEGPTGTLFMFGDIIEPLKKLVKSIKDFNLPLIKFAVIDGKLTSSSDVIKLSALPSREVLLTQIAIGLKSPISGLHRALNWNLQKFVMTLSAIMAAKPALAVAAPVAPTEPVASEPVAVPEIVVEPTAQVQEVPAETKTPVKPETPTESKTQEEIKEATSN